MTYVILHRSLSTNLTTILKQTNSLKTAQAYFNHYIKIITTTFPYAKITPVKNSPHLAIKFNQHAIISMLKFDPSSKQ